MPALTPQVCKLHQNKETLFPGLFSSGLIICAETQRANKCPVLALLRPSPLGAWTGSERSQTRGVDRPILAISWSIEAERKGKRKKNNKQEAVFQGYVEDIARKFGSVFFLNLFFHLNWIVLWLEAFFFHLSEEPCFYFSCLWVVYVSDVVKPMGFIASLESHKIPFLYPSKTTSFHMGEPNRMSIEIVKFNDLI